ncbi:Neuroblastoma breakpoint family member protein [Actinidia chinensis var. chinensis]|uniref:Neuroblastoma breakpoint family member protein n=1 Tax=Actinidia chinensis var. chinensis TaxID=1590841 RepID=A0A2R6QG33_ACTCC|nr:Neuroblastoma breakpoint family member protein [Actinidia chinensis var. chinensis]
MVLDGLVTSPHRRSQSSHNAFSPPSIRKQYSKGDELESCSTLLQRHRFLLTALALLAFLCTIYLYFAVTLGAGKSCSGLTGSAKALCHVEQGKATMAKGKLKFF